MTGAERTRTKAAAEAQAPSLEEMLKARHPGPVYHVFDGSSHYWRSRQTSSGVQRNLASIPPGSKAVVIHPKVQEKMEADPEYAKEILERIEAWWTFDVARNEAIIPGISAGMSQSIATYEDGNIANVQASSGPSIPKKTRTSKE